MKTKILIFSFFLIAMYACNMNKKDSKIIVGTYTDAGSEGLSIWNLDFKNNTNSKVEELKIFNPSYLALSKDKKYLYSITEGDSLTSKVFSFGLDENNKYKLIDSISVGSGPCYISIDQYNSLGITANYGEGSFSYFSIDKNGKLDNVKTILFEGSSSDTIRQNQPHIHTVRISPNNRYLYVTDLGTDNIYKYNLIDQGDKTIIDIDSFVAFKAPSGSGPRHLTFLDSQSKLYVLTELSGDVLVYDIDEQGNLSLADTTNADEVDAGGSADIHISPNEKYLYTSHRLDNDGISIFSIDEVDGSLKKIGYQSTGIHPRNFLISADGTKMFVANRDSNNIEIFDILDNGLLQKQSEITNISKPVCVIALD